MRTNYYWDIWTKAVVYKSKLTGYWVAAAKDNKTSHHTWEAAMYNALEYSTWVYKAV